MVRLPVLAVLVLAGWGALGQNSTTYIIQYDGLSKEELQEKCNILNCLQIYTNVIQGILVERDPAAASALSVDDPSTLSVTRNTQVTLRVEPGSSKPGADISASDAYYYGGPPFRQLNAPPWLDRIDQVSLPLDNTYTPMNNCSSVTVYIIDTGINANHSEFRFVGDPLQSRVGRGYAVPDPSGHPVGGGTGTDDCQGHGTNVASIIGGLYSGVCKGVALIPIRALDCLGGADIATLVAALDWIVGNHDNRTRGVISEWSISVRIIKMGYPGMSPEVFQNANIALLTCQLFVMVVSLAVSVVLAHRKPRLAPLSSAQKL